MLFFGGHAGSRYDICAIPLEAFEFERRHRDAPSKSLVFFFDFLGKYVIHHVFGTINLGKL